MARKASRRRLATSFNLDSTLQCQIVGLILMALGAVTLLSLLSVTHGAFSDWWAALLRQIFGWGAVAVAAAVIGTGFVLLMRNVQGQWVIPWERVVALELILGAVLALFHLAVGRPDPLAAAEAGIGGGLVGWAISQALVQTVGLPVTVLLLVLVGMAGMLWGLDLSLRSLMNRAAIRIATLAQQAEEATDAVTTESVALTKEVVAVAEPRPRQTARQRTRTTQSRSAPPTRQSAKPAISTGHRLPPLALLDPASPQCFQEAELRERVRTIEETLMAFGVPVKVVSVNQGPTVTQFGAEPGYVERAGKKRKVRVSRITRLADDLALALAASPVRIEAPVPGRSVVGIEVPNPQISVVALRGVMESDAFRSLSAKSKLTLALGRDVSGDAVAADLARMPHLLIAGATGSGKSVCINAIIACLLLQNTPDDLRMMLVDPKRVELTNYNGIPHLLAPVIVEIDEVVGALRWAQQEMDQRYQLFAEAGTRNINGYNRKMARRKSGETLPNIVIIVDELADLMMVAPDEVERLICRLAQMARATGIYLVIATQRPSVDVVTGLIKANFPARISFAVTSGTDSRVVLDTTGAEKLLGRGDMLFLAPDVSAPQRLQGSYVSDRELSKLTAFWRGTGWQVVERPSAAPWAGIVEELEDRSDDLLGEAMELLKRHERVSTSFFQRRLHIGYPRAARLIDELEAMGLVGPDEGGGLGRQVLTRDEEHWPEPRDDTDGKSTNPRMNEQP